MKVRCIKNKPTTVMHMHVNAGIKPSWLHFLPLMSCLDSKNKKSTIDSLTQLTCQIKKGFREKKHSCSLLWLKGLRRCVESRYTKLHASNESEWEPPIICKGLPSRLEILFEVGSIPIRIPGKGIRSVSKEMFQVSPTLLLLSTT